MARGQRRAGVAVGGVRPGRAPLVATRAAGGWRLDGQVPWVTGWGLIDLVLVAARDGEHGDVLWLLVDAPAVDGPGDRLRSAVPTIRLRRIAIAACDHANSAAVAFTGHHVDGDRMLARESFEQWQQADAAGLRTNGHLALGVAGRCATLVAAHRRGDDADSGAASGDDGLAGEIESARTVLASADPPQLPAARAAVAALTWRAAHELLVVEGGRGLGASAHAQRLVREAMLLQVFGSRPSIRDGLLGAIRGGGGRRRPAD